MEIPLELKEAGDLYEGFALLIKLADQYPSATGMPPYQNDVMNYGIAKILVAHSIQPDNIKEMLKIHEGDNFDEVAQDQVVNELIPELHDAVHSQMWDAPTIGYGTRSILSLVLSMGPYSG